MRTRNPNWWLSMIFAILIGLAVGAGILMLIGTIR